jgi:hypothetical protein
MKIDEIISAFTIHYNSVRSLEGILEVITEQEAIERAKQIAEEQGWIWVESAEAIWHPAWSGRGGKEEAFSIVTIQPDDDL